MIQVGIIGAGRIGQVHLRGIASGVPNACIRSLADPAISPQAEQLARSLGVQHIMPDYHDIIDDPKIDAIILCSPTNLHAKISIEAIRAALIISCVSSVCGEWIETISEIRSNVSGVA